MKIKNLLTLVCLIVGINTISFGQTNLMANWAGPDGTGTGAASDYGWAVMGPNGEPAGEGVVAFNPANAGSGVRYMDVTSGHTLNGAPFVGRLLLLRWDASNEVSKNYVYSYPVALQANQQYKFSWVYEWWNNATQPTYTVGISTDMGGLNQIATQTFEASDTRNVLKEGEMTFTAPAAGVYYVTVQATTATLSGVGKFSLVAMTTTSSAKELAASKFEIYPNPSKKENGFFIANTDNTNEMVELYIYGITGSVQKHLTLNTAQVSKVDISDLAAGMYVAKVVTSKGSFNKTLVVK